MAITRLNHAVLYVRDARRHADWYRDVLGFREVASFKGDLGVFLQAPDSENDHDVAFFTIGDDANASSAGRLEVGLYHLAWEVPTLSDLADHADRLRKAGALVGASDHVTTKSLYAKDPDGIEFEVMWHVPRSLLTESELAQAASIQPLHLEAEITRFGPDTRGGP